MDAFILKTKYQSDKAVLEKKFPDIIEKKAKPIELE